jgi:hypothetical protein
MCAGCLHEAQREEAAADEADRWLEDRQEDERDAARAS